MSERIPGPGGSDEVVRVEHFAGPAASVPKILSSAEFVASFIPPDYLIDGLLQRRFLYTLTAPTGAGKTAVLMLITHHVERGLALGARRVKPGRVLFLSGENPDDVRMRWLAMAHHLGFDPDTMDVFFIAGAFAIREELDRIRREVRVIGDVSMVAVDTSAAFFAGGDENSNVDMGAHARDLRALTGLPGGPCVVVACHPVKNAGNDNLLPRGGGAFIAEVDGNLVCRKSDSVVDLHWQGKFRGPDFEPIGFELSTVTAPALVDSDGKRIPTVMAKALTDEGRAAIENRARNDEDQVLLRLDAAPGESIANVARALDWMGRTGEPQKSRVHNALGKLKCAGLTQHSKRDGWEIVEKGRTEAKKVRGKLATAGARY